jgi:hypothetical protein
MIGSRTIDDVEYPTLYYTLDDLFSKVSAFSLYKLQAMEEDMDNFAISDSERDFFDLQIKRVARDVFKKFSVMSQGIEDAMQFKSDDLSSTSLDEGVSIVYIICLPTYWDDNQTESLDQKVEESLISGVLQAWFNLKQLKDIHALEKGNYEDLLAELKSLVNTRTQPPKTTYRTF